MCLSLLRGTSRCKVDFHGADGGGTKETVVAGRKQIIAFQRELIFTEVALIFRLSSFSCRVSR